MKLFSFFGERAPETASAVPIIQLETLGREHSGKTGTKAMLFKLTQAGPMSSGLDFTTEDPRQLIAFMNQAIRTYQGLHSKGFTSTIEPEIIQYSVYLGDRQVAKVKLRESIGQLITYDTPDGEKRFEEMFDKHHDNLAKADVIQVFISCPTNDRSESLERLQNDLTVLMPNLRKVLNCRRSARKVAVALVLSKPDAAFSSPEEAKSALTDERLRGMLHRIVTLLESSDRVGLAAIIPVSSFGYGKARKLETNSEAPTGEPDKGFSLLSQGEEEWVLKSGEMPTPHNLSTLVWWSLMAGIALKPADSNAQRLAQTARMLAEDLKNTNAWFVPLNCQ